MIKNLLVIQLAVLVCLGASAQTNTFPSTGKVGIGTTTPATDLHITNPTTSPWLSIDKPVNFEGGIQFKRTGTTLFYLYSDNTDNDALKIQSTTLTGENDAFPRIHIPYTNKNLYFVQSGGSVAMGHANPYSASRLHLKSPEPSQWGFVTEASSNQKMIGVGHDGSAGIISVSYLGTAGYSPLHFRTSDQTRMVLDVNGNLGIGQTVPLAKVHVSEGDLLLQNSTSGYPRIFLKDVSGANSLRIDYNSLIGEGGKLYVQTTGGQPVILNQASGNVGIGTANPTEKLTVNGKIYTKEIKVDLSVPGPDYVFEQDYQLTRLDELKAYLEENKHLPEVPSAKEMERDGVNVGDMEMILLKKIEEMTLHMIRMNERINILEQENKQLKEK